MRRSAPDKGFTLIELLVVVGIIGILAAIAIPVFLNQKARGYEAQVKSDVTNLAKSIETAFADGATDLTREDDALTDGDRLWPVATTTDVQWNVHGTQAGYCIVGWSTTGGKYKPAAPLVYDSTAGGLTKDADCSGIDGLPARFFDGGYTAPSALARSQMTMEYDLALGCTDRTLVLPITGGPDGTIDWGDGTSEQPMTTNAAHTYATVGKYTVTLTGTIPAINHATPVTTQGDARCLVSVPTWGRNTGTTSLARAFQGATNLTYVATPPATITNLNSTFASASKFNGDVSKWNTSNVTDMNSLFFGASLFNGDVSKWNTSNVTDMSLLFSTSRFNGDVSAWDTSKVTRMAAMFQGLTAFNSDISGWNTANVTGMNSMFNGSTAFNGDISGWDTSKVTLMNHMFQNASVFDQDLSRWDTGNVITMANMFSGATRINANLTPWDTSKVTDMSFMFSDARAFNADLSGWNVASVRNMSNMFHGATAMTADLSAWNVAAVTNRLNFNVNSPVRPPIWP